MNNLSSCVVRLSCVLLQMRQMGSIPAHGLSGAGEVDAETHLYMDALGESTGTTQTKHRGRLPGGNELSGEVCDVQELAELTRGRESSGRMIGRSRGLREGQRMEHVRN